MHNSRPPPNISVSTPEQKTLKLDNSSQPHLPKPPSSATDSVVSLPLLNMVRGVPFSHRVPLRVTNPDRMSIISELDVIITGPTNTSQSLSSVAVANVRDRNNTLSVPVVQQSSHKIVDEDVKNSSASILSTDTRCSRSSVSSRSSPDDHQVSTEEREREGKDDDPEFLIVFLGAKLDRDPTSWHGLEKQSSIRSLPADRHSPWISPLARPDSIHYQHRQSVASSDLEPNSDESGDEEEGWMNSPVVHMKPMMEAMGIIPNTAYFRSAPVIPSIQYYPSTGNTGSPLLHQSPYLYSSPQLDSPSYSPSYFPTWSPFPPTASPLTRPLSQAYSPATYASPYLPTHNCPF